MIKLGHFKENPSLSTKIRIPLSKQVEAGFSISTEWNEKRNLGFKNVHTFVDLNNMEKEKQ